MKKIIPFPLAFLHSVLAQNALETRPNSPETFNNIECRTGFICVDLNLDWANAQTDNIERDLTFGKCKLSEIPNFQSNVSSNYMTYCAPWESNRKTWGDCGAELTVEDVFDENLNVWFRFLVYSITAKLNTGWVSLFLTST